MFLVADPDDPELEALVAEHLRRMGRRIGELRALQGFTLNQLEEHCGVGFSLLSKIERGRRNISVRTAVRIADALGVQLHELFVPPEMSQVHAREPAETKTRKGARKEAPKRRRRNKSNAG